MLKLLFVDDQPITLSFLENCFNDKNKYEIVGSITQAEIADLWCEKKNPHAIFLDIQTKEEKFNGLIAAEAIKKKYPNIKILMMTGFDEITYLPRAKEIGVDAFIPKSCPDIYFIKALDTVMKGGKIFPEVTPKIPVIKGQQPLTEREIQVLQLVCENFSNKEIADLLFISESTVKRHVENLFKKTGRTGRSGLVAYAVAGGWINPFI